MAGQTIGLGLTRYMRGMALGAIWDEFVFFLMAGAAGQIGVLAFLLLELGHLVGMAGETWFGEIVCQTDNQRRVRVFMAAETVGQLEMIGSGMALTALGDDLLHFGRMAGMAVHAGDLGFVGSSVAGDILGRLIMAFDTVSLGQYRRRRRCRCGACGHGDKQASAQQTSEYEQIFFCCHHSLLLCCHCSSVKKGTA